MKKYLIFCMFAFCVFNLNAEISSSASDNETKVNLLKKLTITKGSDLAFGNIAFVQGGNLVMNPTSGAITGGSSTTVDSVSGTGTPGSISITGPDSQAVTLTYPNTINLAIGGTETGATITDLSFASGDNGDSSVALMGSSSGETASRAITLSSNGTSILKIGGKLNITDNTTSGLSEGLYTLTVSY